MRYGHFDSAAREYVVDRPDTPRSWSNYLGTTRYGAIITNNAGGYSFYRSAVQGRFTRLQFNSVPMDQPGRYFYLRDAADGDFWSASWQPVGKPLDSYQSSCRHGTAYTVIESRYRSIRTEATYLVPLGCDFELWILKVRNDGETPRRLSVFSYVELASEWHLFHDLLNLQYSQYIIDCSQEGQFIQASMCPHLAEDPASFTNRDQSRHSYVGLVGAPVAGFDTDRDRFLGRYGDYARPAVVAAGKCEGSLAHGDNPCGTFQVDLELAPGEERSFMIILGVGKAARDGVAAAAAFPTVERGLEALEELRAHWHARIDSLQVQTPDEELDHMLNTWSPYNCQMTYAWSRAASLVYSGERDGLGYRDTVQDLLGVMAAIPVEARERLELMLTGQCSHGGAMPVVKPFDHHPGKELLPKEEEYRSDDSLWLFETVPAYVKESGRLDFLQRVLPFADAGEGTVLEHLRRAAEFSWTRRGVHGLPCGLSADWNDALKLGPKGESVFVAMQLRRGLVVLLELAELLGDVALGEWAAPRLSELDLLLERHAWDGRYYLRAYHENGSKIGASGQAEGSLFLNPQAWAVLAGAGTREQQLASMNAVHEELATPFGIALCEPPFVTAEVAVIRATLFNPSMKENAGIFCHPQGWAVIAEAMLGRGERAYEYVRAYLPSAYNERAEVREIEPYVYCQSTHGKGSRRYGASRLPWLSGTAAWSQVATTQYLLGIRPDFTGLRVDPAIPAQWGGFRATRKFRGATYEIEVRNPAGVEHGVRELLVNGVAQPASAPIPVAPAGSTVQVVVVMG